MFKEILKIIPKLDSGDLAAMERSLSKRFSSVAKKFGKGLVSALSGGGIAGLALGLIDKLLNPLKETQEAIDRTLKNADDLVTNAKQFNTTSGKLARLHAVGEATGLDAGTLDMLITKFQTAIAEAKADPKKVTSVRQFVGVKDSADAFFEFIQGLKKLNTNQQILVQQEVFGEKQILKVADFLQSAGEVASRLKGPTSEQLTPRVDKLGDLNDRKDFLKAQQDLNDLFKKGGLITASMIDSQSKQQKQELDRENKQIQSYISLAEISLASNQLLDLGKTMLLNFTGLVVKVTDLANNVKKIAESRPMQGIMKFIGGK